MPTIILFSKISRASTYGLTESVSSALQSICPSLCNVEPSKIQIVASLEPVTITCFPIVNALREPLCTFEDLEIELTDHI